MQHNSVTIKDLAKELGISPSTVSRALKDHPDISESTKKAVKALALKLDYQPNEIALSLRHSKSFRIGVVLPEFVHHFFSSVISGIEEVANAHGYNIIICQSHENYEKEKANVNAMLSSRVDGLLISVSKNTEEFGHLLNVQKRGVPLVFFDRMCHEIDASAVIVDDKEGAYHATLHLIERGHQRIAHMAGPPALELTHARIEGYKKALAEKNIPFDPKLIINCLAESDTQVEGGKKVTKQFINMEQRPDAIFCSNDEMAIGAINYLNEVGLSIPNDVAVVGFSDWRMASYVQPPLTSVAQPGVEMGEKAAELLIKEIESKNKEEIEHEIIELKTNLVIRASS